MNTSESESSPPQPTDLRVELGAKSPRHFKAMWLVPLLAFLVVGSVTLLAWLPNSSPTPSLAPSAAIQPSPQPKITWSENHIEVILSPGESTAKDITFTSSQNLTNVTVAPVPAIAPFVTLTPSTFSRVQANTPQTVRVNFAIAPNTTLGTYQGTIQLRIGTQTLPQTLKVATNVWRAVATDSFTVLIPPTFSSVTYDDDLKQVYAVAPSDTGYVLRIQQWFRDPATTLDSWIATYWLRMPDSSSLGDYPPLKSGRATLQHVILPSALQAVFLYQSDEGDSFTIFVDAPAKNALYILNAVGDGLEQNSNLEVNTAEIQNIAATLR